MVVDPNGLHARPAAHFVKAMSLCPAEVQIKFKDKSANAKSILSVLGLGISQNDNIDILYDTDQEELVSKCEDEVGFLKSI